MGQSSDSPLFWQRASFDPWAAAHERKAHPGRLGYSVDRSKWQAPADWYRDHNMTQRVTQLFPLIDVNQDGYVDMDELKAWHFHNRLLIEQARANRSMQHHDKDGDGVLSLEEWLADVHKSLDRMFDHHSHDDWNFPEDEWDQGDEDPDYEEEHYLASDDDDHHVNHDDADLEQAGLPDHEPDFHQDQLRTQHDNENHVDIYGANVQTGGQGAVGGQGRVGGHARTAVHTSLADFEHLEDEEDYGLHDVAAHDGDYDWDLEHSRRLDARHGHHGHDPESHPREHYDDYFHDYDDYGYHSNSALKPESSYGMSGPERLYHYGQLFVAADEDHNEGLDHIELRHLLNPQLSKIIALRKAHLNMTLANDMYGDDGRAALHEGRFSKESFQDNVVHLFEAGEEEWDDEHEEYTTWEKRKTDEWFAKLDSNKDGYVDLDELLTAFDVMWVGDRKFAHVSANSQIQQADKDGDGKLSLYEMIDAIHVFYEVVDPDPYHLESASHWMHDEL